MLHRLITKTTGSICRNCQKAAISEFRSIYKVQRLTKNCQICHMGAICSAVFKYEVSFSLKNHFDHASRWMPHSLIFLSQYRVKMNFWGKTDLTFEFSTENYPHMASLVIFENIYIVVNLYTLQMEHNSEIAAFWQFLQFDPFVLAINRCSIVWGIDYV